ncbi:MAG TPA: alpha/beta fold hydrolase [Pyrinomonadaceae bacterium]|jgi:pimeloyl-ACP methyl ester carboxylesterase/DNA-binding winged helix-turn-helix (wHTH) protein/class 3 adenylate cyclase|nr:alpha/beta fold hydrolase [Pyrinomonadaceae bacterium]
MVREIAARVYRFSDFELDGAERVLRRGDTTIQLAPKAFDTLMLLVSNGGRVISKEQMLSDIWDGSFVEENNLAQNISLLRRALRESEAQKFIETVPKFGYRFVCPVDAGNEGVKTEVFEQSSGRIYIDEPAVTQKINGGATLPKIRPVTQYVQNGDVNIAYQVVGDGPVDIVFVMGWVSHLEYFWKHHTFGSFLEKLASFSRLILFDKRGTGLSDRVPIDKLPTLEQRMEDVHAVMDAVGSERAVLVGVSEGGPMCSLFAATYPERTAGLVMIGTYAKRIRDDDYPWAPTEEQRNAFFDLMRKEWGGPVGIEERAPSMAEDPDFRKWWSEYLRNGASPGAAVALTQMNAEIDVRDILPSVRVPTLVIHREGDLCLKVEEGRYVAERIPDAKYVELDGIDHLPFVGDQDSVIREIEEFVAGLRFAGEYDRVLATVMSVSFADAAGELERRGTKDWTDFVERSREFIRRKLQINKGREVSVTDDETLAAFDGPARAIRCAAAVNDAAAGQGVELRIGLHTGECDVVEGSYSGFAVELARHVAGLSTGGNIVVSRTVKDLVAGSGIKFKELGTRSFDGVDGKWHLFTVALVKL